MGARIGAFELRYNQSGFRVLEGLLPAVAPTYRKCTVYLYPSKADAERGERIGGSGFLVGVLSVTRPDVMYVHVVTNAHVIDGGNYVVRFNTKDGNVATVESDPAEWVVSTTDDLGVYPVDVPAGAEIMALAPDIFIDETCEIDGWPLFPGDDVYLFGRFITHDGKQRNKPVVRFGSISMLPDPDATVRINNRDQLAFLVECRSLGGFSGSPAFVRLAQPRLMDEDTSQKKGWIPLYSKFLGVDCGHLPYWSGVREKAHPTAAQYPNMWAETNSGIAIVIPAWRLMALINDPRLVRERERLDREMADHGAIAVPDSQTPDDRPFTKADFERALKKVAKKQPDSETARTSDDR